MAVMIIPSDIRRASGERGKYMQNIRVVHGNGVDVVIDIFTPTSLRLNRSNNGSFFGFLPLQFVQKFLNPSLSSDCTIGFKDNNGINIAIVVIETTLLSNIVN